MKDGYKYFLWLNTIRYCYIIITIRLDESATYSTYDRWQWLYFKRKVCKIVNLTYNHWCAINVLVYISILIIVVQLCHIWLVNMLKTTRFIQKIRNRERLLIKCWTSMLEVFTATLWNVTYVLISNLHSAILSFVILLCKQDIS